MIEKTVGPRIWRVAALSLVALTAAACGGASAGASSTQTIDIGAVVPLTGPNAESGQMYRTGAQLAVDEINRAGGVKALGGAKLRLDGRDAGTQTSDTVLAMQSLLTSTAIVAGIGAGVSSNSIAGTAVSEQHQIPWIDVAFDDSLTQRGFKYLFITSPLQSQVDTVEYPAVETLAKQAGVNLKNVAIIYSPNPNSALSAQHITQVYAPRFGWSVVLNREVPKDSMTGAVLTTMVSSIKAAKPQVLFIGTSVNDVINIQRQEIAQGMTPVPWVLVGAPYLSKSFINALGAAGTQGIMSAGSAGVYPSDQALAGRIAKAGEVPQEYNLVGYSEVYLIYDALQKAKSTDHVKLRDALASINIKGGPAGSVWPCDCLKFDPSGRTSTGEAVLVQWQKGKAVTVYPEKVATAKPYWPKT